MIAYISRFYLENYKSFQGAHDFDLLDSEGKLVQWTVILGNNNTGKTSLLKALAELQPIPRRGLSDENKESGKGIDMIPLNFYRDNGLITEVKHGASTSFIGCDILLSTEEDFKHGFSGSFEKYKTRYYHPTNWGGYPGLMWMTGDFDKLKNMKIYGYGVTRRTSNTGLSERKESFDTQTLFHPESTLLNIKDWLLQLDYASKNNQQLAIHRLEKIKALIQGGLFPDIMDFKFESNADLENTILFKTISGWYRFEELGYGYQSTLSWLIDFCKKMFDRYPDSPNPLAEPAIVLIDEIDLHLHPSWQKNVVRYLSKIFPSTQFIVTTHSPLVIQSIEKINLFVLSRGESGIQVRKSPRSTYRGWSVEEILEDVMKIENGTYSESYHQLLDEFDKALDEDDYQQAKNAYDQLDAILHPTSPERKILKIQLSQVSKEANNG